MKLAIIGLGNMGQAILSGVLKAEIIKAKDIIAADKKFAESNFKVSDEFSEIIVTADNKRAVREADYVILAVKPQIIKFVLEDIKDFAESKVIISIAAGINTRVLSNISLQMQK